MIKPGDTDIADKGKLKGSGQALDVQLHIMNFCRGLYLTRSSLSFLTLDLLESEPECGAHCPEVSTGHDHSRVHLCPVPTRSTQAVRTKGLGQAHFDHFWAPVHLLVPILASLSCCGSGPNQAPE